VTYEKMKKRNMFSYELYNPLTKDEEMRKYFHKIENCSNSNHNHEGNQTEESVHPDVMEGERVEKGFRIIRPHSSEKRILDIFGESEHEFKIDSPKKRTSMMII
jgi:hypothetical protein